MKTLLASILFACACVGPALANPPITPSEDAAAVAALKQQAQDLGDAMVAADIDKLNQIFADDWVSVGSSGKLVTKDSVLSNFKSGNDKLEAFEINSMNVQVFGNIATIQGSVTEKRSRNGKEASGQFVWMDLAEKRAGKWVVVRSLGSKVK